MPTDMIATLGQKIAAQILREPNRKINPTEPLISSGLIDSMSLVDVALLVEDLYDVHIDDTELNAETFDTLEQLAGIIEARLQL
jgi:acyl carrier protein